MYKMLIVMMMLSFTVLVGCFGTKPEEELYVIFEEAVKQEAQLFEDTKKLTALEQKNGELYDIVLQSGQDDVTHAQDAIKEATAGIEERSRILKQDREVLQKAQEKMKEADSYIKQLEDAKLSEPAKRVVTLYRDRFKAFESMQTQYTKALEAESKLYELLQAKTESLKTIASQVKEVNRLYGEMEAHNTAFNTLTKQYNTEKVAFYQQANIQIQEPKK